VTLKPRRIEDFKPGMRVRWEVDEDRVSARGGGSPRDVGTVVGTIGESVRIDWDDGTVSAEPWYLLVIETNGLDEMLKVLP
jgi:hypothetical protein